MENIRTNSIIKFPKRTHRSKVLKIMDIIVSVSRNPLISSWSTARWLNPTKKPLEMDKDQGESIDF